MATPPSKLFHENDSPLVLSKYFTPFNIPHTGVNFSPVKWFFMPGFHLDIPFFITVAAVVISIIGFALLPLGRPGFIAFAVLQVIAVILGFIRINIGWNNNLRTNLCYCYSKSEQAKSLWAPETAHERLLQKDVFHEESGVGYKIRVLRDGTVEMHAGDLGDTLLNNLTTTSDKSEVSIFRMHQMLQTRWVGLCSELASQNRYSNLRFTGEQMITQVEEDKMTGANLWQMNSAS